MRGQHQVRVCHLVLSLDVGGVERGVLNLAVGLAGRGIRSSVVCIRRPGPLWNRLPGDAQRYCLGYARGFHPAGVLRLAWFLHRSGADILHTHNRAALVWGGLARYLAPRIRWVHGHYGEDWRCNRRDLSLLRRAYVLNTVSPHLAGQIGMRLNEAGLQSPSVDVIPNGVDTGMFRPDAVAGSVLRNRFGFPEDAFVYATIGRLCPLKNHETIIRAFARVVRKSEGGTQGKRIVRLVLFGDGPDRERLVGLCERLGIEDAVECAGTCLDLPRLLPGVDVFLHASRSEGMPNAVIEAAACGVPMILSDIPAHRLLIRDGDTGVLVSPLDVSAWADAMERLAADPELRGSLASAARDDVVQRFPLERMLDGYAALYRKVMAGARGK